MKYEIKDYWLKRIEMHAYKCDWKIKMKLHAYPYIMNCACAKCVWKNDCATT